ncbi:unnamed protein product [Urochloa decumbens]|uniref:Uncharacterized protein n=1 Tax=Urochloa decumbens TaxID=240449 RepID=A0ABC9FT98_9POAL
MVMPPRPCSSGTQSIRRELQRRRPKPLAPKRTATTKQSAPLPPPPPRPKLQEDPSSTAPAASRSAGTHAPRPPRPRPHAPPRPAAISHSTLPPPLRFAPSSIGSSSPSTLGTEERLGPGTEVGVRTRTTTLKTGKVLVLWLRAMVVSPTHAGYDVVYDGNWPPGDPYGTVHVPRRHVRKIEPSPSPSSAPSSSASDAGAAAVAAALKKEMRPPPRPTTAGKSLRLIRRSLLQEMEGKTQAALLGY